MKKIIAIIAGVGMLMASTINAQSLQTFHSFTGVTILGDTVPFSQWAGKKLLVVNTANLCGYTPQFLALQALDSTYQNNNFEVIGFPCNDFGGQNPGDDTSTLSFCIDIYGVQFQMMSIIGIALPDTAEWYKWLQWQYLNGVANAPVTWNFNKFCIDEAGNWIAHYPQTTLPFDTAIVNWILSPPNTTGIKSQIENYNVQLINNPTVENFELQVNALKAGELLIDVLTLEGKIMSSENVKVKTGTNKIVLNHNYKNGMYFVSIKSEGFYQTLKALKTE